MSVESRDLRWAVTVAQYDSLRQAADALNIRQSTLSRGLRHLEDELGAVLFKRTNGGTRPTVEGAEFLEDARRILDEISTIVARIKSLSRGESGRLTIGVHAALSAGNLRATLIEHRQRFPGVEARLVDGSSDRLFGALENSAIDIAFVVARNGNWTGRSLPVWSERVIVAIPADHPLGGREVMHWSDLKQETFILREGGPGIELHRLLLQKLGDRGPSKCLRHDTALDRLLSLVGAGWGVLLTLEGATGLAVPGVTFCEIRDSDGPTRLEFRAYWRAANPNPSLQPFLAMLRERYPDISIDSSQPKKRSPTDIHSQSGKPSP
ncbi:LysR family transcriptional regulator [Xanthobacter sp. DSM 24535]|uniref:LysR substrate-binding domain-containing protein n=1 Tax=Roseixanthobacter psychrophilus TaxID=3119917 RepID=UPI00372BD6BC